MDKYQNASNHSEEVYSSAELPDPVPVTFLHSVMAHGCSQPQDISISPSSGKIIDVHPSGSDTVLTASATPDVVSCLALPSLCHPHIHLDKAHLLSHPKYNDLRPKDGTFTEALSLTGKAKAIFTSQDLLERGNWLIADSIRAGVTHMRAFVEADATVGHLSVEAGVELKRKWKRHCHIQLCVFAQDPTIQAPDRDMTSGRKHADENRKNVLEVLDRFKVEVKAVGSTPYVEASLQAGRDNIEWMIELAQARRLNLDFHLDYHLDPEKESLVHFVLQKLREGRWVDNNPDRTVCLGHCSRLTLFGEAEWEQLRDEAQGLPVYFIGLPTSDLFMMARPETGAEQKDRVRGTLPLLAMKKKYGLNVALGVNNVGNPFTPQGSADPLSVASMGVGLYQGGLEEDAEILYECVSASAKRAIGLSSVSELKLQVHQPADITLFGPSECNEPPFYRRRRVVQEIVYDAGPDRAVIKRGCINTLQQPGKSRDFG